MDLRDSREEACFRRELRDWLVEEARWITAFLGGPVEARRRVAASLLD